MTLEQSSVLRPQPTIPPPEQIAGEPQLEFTSETKAEVRGHTTYNQPVGPLLRCAALLLDWGVVMALLSLGALLLQLNPRIALVVLGAGALTTLVLLTRFIHSLMSKTALRRGIAALPTLGKYAWSLKTRNGTLLQCDLLTSKSVFIGTLSTTLSILVALTLIRTAIFEHPVWLKAGDWNTAALTPVTSMRPFFYSLADWPKKFLNQPVFYTVLYEKGPPQRFVGHISAQLGSPRIRLLIEGPKTPEKIGTTEELKSCLSKNSWSCLGIKEAALGRHFNEMSRVFSNTSSLPGSWPGFWPNRWKLKWFTITPAPEGAAASTPQAPTQGVYLSAIGPQFTQDRFIFINANGQHQAVILTRPSLTPLEPSGVLSEKTDEERKADQLHNSLSLQAYELLLHIVRSMKTLNRLDEGRAWVNQELQEVQLSEVRSMSDPLQKSEALAEIQRVLLSRISVDPASFDAYFHLAGTSYLLAKNAQDTGLNSSPLLLEALSAAIQNLSSARRYAADLAPADPRTAQIESLWLEIQKNSKK